MQNKNALPPESPARAGGDRVGTAQPGDGAGAGTIRAVLVDDSSLVRGRVAALLSGLGGIEVVGQAADVAGGRRLIEEHRPEILILDLDLFGESGLELLRVIKPQNTSVLVIMLTNHDHPNLRARCAELGAGHYFHKTTEIEKLMDVCRREVARRDDAMVIERREMDGRMKERFQQSGGDIVEALQSLREAMAND